MPRNDPYRNFRFRVEIDNIPTAAFSEVQLGATTIDVVEYREGTDPPHVRKLSGLTRYGNVTLRRGITSSRDLSDWLQDISAGQLLDRRRRVVIIVQDESGQDQARFVVVDAWPVKYEISPLDAKGNEVLIELLELVNEGIERVA